MAEIALGGFEIAITAKRVDRECRHTQTLSTITAGLERTVCEDCGHLTISERGGLDGPIERARFARPADSLHEETESATIRERPKVTVSSPHIVRESSPLFTLDEAARVRRRQPDPWPAAIRTRDVPKTPHPVG